MPKKETVDSVKQHTEAKLQFYTQYLERYIQILLRSPWIDKINIYDLYCGAGLYSDGKTGSAIRAADSILDAISNKNDKIVNLHLNDLSKRKTKKIKSLLSPKSESEEGFNISYSNIEALEFISKLIEHQSNQGRKTRNLLFIDPYGYKDIKRESLEHLLESGRTEIVLFLPIEQMYRFKGMITDDEIDASYVPLKHFIEQFSIDVSSISSEKQFIKIIELALRFNGKYYSASYNIKNHTGHYYGMFFITPSLLGLDKIVEVKWKLDDQAGDGFTGDNQLDLFLETDRQSELHDSILNFIDGQGVDNLQLYEFVLSKGFRTTHAVDILAALCEEGKIQTMDLKTQKPARKRTFKLNYTEYKSGKSSIVFRKTYGETS